MSVQAIDRYAVMGKPIAHSKSPLIHAAFAEQTHQRLEYSRIEVEPGTLATAVEDFRSQGGKGLNITVPLKQEAHTLATRLSPRAELAGAVNTLVLETDGELFGDNTDGPGLVTDLVHNHDIALADRRVLLLGAGGAARGVLAPLLEGGPRQLHIANRTAERAAALATRFASMGAVTGGGFDTLGETTQSSGFDLIINASAASLHGEAPPLPDNALAADGGAYDLMYAAEPTPFMRWATVRSSGPCLDGLGMLVEQAAESFALWRGQRPATAPVIAQLRAQ